MPYNDLSYLSDEEVRDFNIWDYNEDSEYGFVLCISSSEIDMSYHDYFIDLSIFPMKLDIYKKEISDYQKHILMKNHFFVMKN